MHTVKVTLGTNKLEPRGQCETAGGAVVSLNELFEFSCLTRPSIDIPFVFCSVSQRMVRPPERIITGCSAAHEGKPYSQNCCCLKAVTKDSLHALRLLHSNYCSIFSLLSEWSCRPDLTKPLHHSFINTWKGWLHWCSFYSGALQSFLIKEECFLIYLLCPDGLGS